VGIPALADFNRDGSLDAVSRGSNGFDVQLGNGDGTFQPSQTYEYGPGAGHYGAEAMGASITTAIPTWCWAGISRRRL